MILLFFTILLYLLSLIGLSTQMSIDNFKPFLESSYISLFNSSYSYITYNVLSLNLLLIIPKNDIENRHFLGILLVLLNEYIISNMLISELSINVFLHTTFIFISSLLVIMFISVKLKKIFR